MVKPDEDNRLTAADIIADVASHDRSFGFEDGGDVDLDALRSDVKGLRDGYGTSWAAE